MKRTLIFIILLILVIFSSPVFAKGKKYDLMNGPAFILTDKNGQVFTGMFAIYIKDGDLYRNNHVLYIILPKKDENGGFLVSYFSVNNVPKKSQFYYPYKAEAWFYDAKANLKDHIHYLDLTDPTTDQAYEKDRAFFSPTNTHWLLSRICSYAPGTMVIKIEDADEVVHTFTFVLSELKEFLTKELKWYKKEGEEGYIYNPKEIEKYAKVK